MCQGGFAVIHYGYNAIIVLNTIGIWNNIEVAIKEQLISENEFDNKIIGVLREIGILSFCNHENIA